MRDEGVSEVLGTVMLTAVTVVLVSGFGIIVFTTMTGTDEPRPTAAFTIEAVSGLSYVNVSMREGSSFLLEEARYAMGLDGVALSSPGALVSPAEAGRFSPGDIMRFDLPAGTQVATGANFTFFAADTDSNAMIGYATVSVPGSAGLPAFSSNAVTLGAVAFSPSTLTADGATTTTVTVAVASTTGLALVESVTADLADVGGGTLTLRDDGVGADAVANDGIFSGSFSASSSILGGATAGSATIPITASDVMGHTVTDATGTISLEAEDITDLVNGLIANSTSATNILGVGGISRNLPSSATIESLTVTNFTWADIGQLANDLVIYRVSDLTDYSKTWAVQIYFDDCASPNGAVTEIIMKRDGMSNGASWRPASGCFTLDGGSELQLIDLNTSTDANGATETWEVDVRTNAGNEVAGDPGDYAYTSADISSLNQGLVPFFHDSIGGGGPETGLGTAHVEWTEFDNRDPTASIALTVTGTRAVSASAAGSTDPDGDALTYKWLWGDGSSSSGSSATHTYASVGAYTVRLYANDSAGGSDWTESTTGSAPTAIFNATARGLTVYATGAASTDPAGLALTYAWTFGNGGTATGSPVLYTYAANATDTVTLTVTNAFGATASVATSVLHNGTMYATCPATSAAVGTVTSCASLLSASDSGASAAFTEGTNSSRQQLYVHLDVVGFAEASKTHTVEVRARQTAGTAEALSFQVRDASSGLWSTPTGFTWSSTTASTATYVLTASQWNNGDPDFRFVDSACASTAYTCTTGSDSNAATWAVDWVRVISS